MGTELRVFVKPIFQIAALLGLFFVSNFVAAQSISASPTPSYDGSYTVSANATMGCSTSVVQVPIPGYGYYPMEVTVCVYVREYQGSTLTDTFATTSKSYSSKAVGTYTYKLEQITTCAMCGSGGQLTVFAVTDVNVVSPPAPSAPSVSTSSPSSCTTSLSVNWTPGSGYLSGATKKYDLQESVDAGASWGNVSGYTNTTATSWSRALGSESINYAYRVRSFYTLGASTSPASSWTSATVSKGWCAPGAPGTPNLSLVAPASSTHISVSWSAASGTVHGYKIQRRDVTLSSGWSTFTKPGTGTTYTDNDPSMIAGNTYEYRVLAYNGVDGSVGGAASIYILSTPAQATYTYDALGRLIGVQRPDGTETNYTYDQVGNRIVVESN